MHKFKIDFKKISLILMIFLLSVALFSCGNKNTNDVSKEKNKTKTEQQKNKKLEEIKDDLKQHDQEQTPVNNQEQYTNESSGGAQPTTQTQQQSEQVAPNQQQSPAQGGNQEGCVNDAIFN